MATVSVRYIVHDVDQAIAFYTENLGFTEVMHPAPSFAMLTRGDLRLILSAPAAGPAVGRPSPMGPFLHREAGTASRSRSKTSNSSWPAFAAAASRSATRSWRASAASRSSPRIRRAIRSSCSSRRSRRPAFSRRSRFVSHARAVQDRLGVARRLRDAVKGKRPGSEERLAIERGGHRPVIGISRVLLIDYGRHPPERRVDLCRRHDAVPEPVGDVLR